MVNPPVAMVEVADVEVAENHPILRLPKVVEAALVIPEMVRLVVDNPVPCAWVKRRF